MNVMLVHERDELFKMLYKKSFKYSPYKQFKLVSGNESPYYFDCKATILDSEGLAFVGNLFAKFITHVVKSKRINCIGGLEFGAIPITLSTCMIVNPGLKIMSGKTVNPLIVRKEPKKHGTQKWIEGNFKKNDKVVVVDDVITTGGSTIKAIERMREAKLDVIHAVVLIDREEFNGRRNIENLGVPVTSIFKASDFKEKL